MRRHPVVKPIVRCALAKSDTHDRTAGLRRVRKTRVADKEILNRRNGADTALLEPVNDESGALQEAPSILVGTATAYDAAPKRQNRVLKGSDQSPQQ
jgi:hypothetical protein